MSDRNNTKEVMRRDRKRHDKIICMPDATRIVIPKKSAVPKGVVKEKETPETELERLHAKYPEGITLEILQQEGYGNYFKQVITPDNFGEIEPGEFSLALLENTKNKNKCKGNCLGGVRLGYCGAEADVTGRRVSEREFYSSTEGKIQYPHAACNSTHIWEDSGKFVLLEFDSDTRNGNPEINNLPGGSMVINSGHPTGFIDSRGKRVCIYGHIAVCGGDGYWYSDGRQTNACMASMCRGGNKAQPYGPKYTVVLSKDDEPSDNLLLQLIKAKQNSNTNMMTRQNESYGR